MGIEIQVFEKRILDFFFIGGGRKQAIGALFDLYPAYSPKRRIMRWLNAGNMAFLRLKPHGMKQISYLLDAIPSCPKGSARAILLHKIDQNGRAYIFDRDPLGQTVAVTKIGVTPAAGESIKRESEILEGLATLRPAFYVPDVLFSTELAGSFLMCTKAVAPGFAIIDKATPIPESLFEAIAALRPGEAKATLPARAFDGWQTVRATMTTPLLKKEADKIDPDAFVAVCAAHCDMGSENVFSRHPAQAPSDFALIDWEFFTESAPALTDRVSVWLGNRHRAFKGDARSDIGLLAAAFLRDFDGAPGGRTSAVLALLQLAEMGIDLARQLCGVPD